MHIVILGNGIAGITAARHIRKLSDHKITVVSGESTHFFSRTALMYIYMGHIRYEHTKPYEDWFWSKNRIDLKKEWVTSIGFDQKELNFATGEKLAYDKLILATGSKPNKFGWPGQNLNGVQGLYSLQDLELMETNTKGISRAVVVGGGLIGVEMAEMLHSRGIHVSFLVRERTFWDIVLPEEEAKMVDRHILEHGIDLRLETELSEILDDGTGRVSGVKTQSGEVIECQFVGLTVGVSPNIDFLKNSDLNIEKGIIVNDLLETNLPDVYAIGDCAQIEAPKSGRRPIEAVWYTGRIMGRTVARTISGHPDIYDPGIWFNSAKFFDIEYQTYGTVSPKRSDNELDFYWEHHTGKIGLRLVYDRTSRQLIGVNNLGLRLRHEVVEDWIKNKKSVEFCLEHLMDANFDPEFYRKHEWAIIGQFNKQNQTSILPKQKSWKRILHAVGI